MKLKDYLNESKISRGMTKKVEKFVAGKGEIIGGHIGYDYDNNKTFYATILLKNGETAEVHYNLRNGNIEWSN